MPSTIQFSVARLKPALVSFFPLRSERDRPVAQKKLIESIQRLALDGERKKTIVETRGMAAQGRGTFVTIIAKTWVMVFRHSSDH
jgi:hypothetical protein